MWSSLAYSRSRLLVLPNNAMSIQQIIVRLHRIDTCHTKKPTNEDESAAPVTFSKTSFAYLLSEFFFAFMDGT